MYLLYVMNTIISASLLSVGAFAIGLSSDRDPDILTHSLLKSGLFRYRPPQIHWVIIKIHSYGTLGSSCGAFCMPQVLCCCSTTIFTIAPQVCTFRSTLPQSRSTITFT